jgi:hypothetical protein
LAPAECETFRPYVLRPLTQVSAVAVLVGFAVLSYGVTAVGWAAWHPLDAVWMNLLGILLALGFWRLGAVAAFATPDGLTVRNVVRTRSFEWAEILGVTFSPRGDQAWPLLDLSDGETYAVMAIQAADGKRGFAACERLRRLVDSHGTPDVDDR